MKESSDWGQSEKVKAGKGNSGEENTFDISGPVRQDASGNQSTLANTTEVQPHEAPTGSALQRSEPVPQQSVEEDLLEITEIQGNILAGFLKDHQALIFLKVKTGQEDNFRKWLRSLEPSIATVDEVLAFNKVWKKLHNRRGENRAVQATWINIAFSYQLLERLTESAAAFKDNSFKAGMRANSRLLGDPQDPNVEGSPDNWLVGGPGNEADLLLVVASDDRDNMIEEVTRIEDSIYAPRDENGQPLQSGLQVIFKQVGETLPSPLTGHEHFGFRDGVSQPGIRGTLSKMKSDFLTPRQNPKDHNQGKPGQDLLWPGEFVFGYHSQDPAQEIDKPGAISDAGPSWAKNGSFLVFRRLRQDVAGFHSFLKSTAEELGLPHERLGAKFVGRWESGAPILRAPMEDNLELAGSECANNHFEFEDASSVIAHKRDANDCLDDKIAPSKGDKLGELCPFAGHIRKAYPRDDENPAFELNEETTQTHRLLRRGIPFGEPLNEKPDAPFHDSGNRGLLFMAYQTSIERQFEFVSRFWVNNPEFKAEGAGHDPILGQNGEGDRSRTFTFKDPAVNGGAAVQLKLEKDWVIPTGGGYFFAPSLSTIKAIANRTI